MPSPQQEQQPLLVDQVQGYGGQPSEDSYESSNNSLSDEIVVDDVRDGTSMKLGATMLNFFTSGLAWTAIGVRPLSMIS
jgi:hypothetical protein